jgi:hypothetical protein
MRQRFGGRGLLDRLAHARVEVQERALLDRDQRIVLGVRILRQHADARRAIGKLADDALEPHARDADDAQVVTIVRQPLDLVEMREAADRVELGAP